MSSTKSRASVTMCTVLAIAIATVLAACTPTDPWAGAIPDDGSVMNTSYLYLANEQNTEAFVELGENDSMPWAVLLTDPGSAFLFIAYVSSVGTGASCGSHLGVEVTESAEAVMIAAVSTKQASTDTCSSEQQISGGYFELQLPVGGRTLLHAPTSEMWDDTEPALDTSVPEPVPLVTPTAEPYAGTASCSNLLDEATTQQLSDLGLVDYSEPFSQNVSEQPMLDVYPFLDHGGIICGWGDDRAMSYAYGYGPISAEDAAQRRDFLITTEGATVSDMAGITVLTVAEYTSTYAFGDGYWAASITMAEGIALPSVFTAPSAPGGALGQIVANAPDF